MAMQSARPQIHQQKRQIIKHVACRERLVEFNRVKQHRPAFDQDDIAQVQISVATAHVSLIFTLSQQGFPLIKSLLHCLTKPRGSLRREDVLCCFEGDERFLDLSFQRAGRICSEHSWRAPVRGGDGASKTGHDFRIEFVTFS